MYTAGAQHSSSRLSIWRPAPQEKLLLCVNVAGPGWASPEKRSRPAHGWTGRSRSWQRSARWHQAFFFFIAGTRRSLVPYTKTKTIFPHCTKIQNFFIVVLIPKPFLEFPDKLIGKGCPTTGVLSTYRGHHIPVSYTHLTLPTTPYV